MKKKILMILMSMMMFSLVACQGDDTEQNSKDTKSNVEQDDKSNTDDDYDDIVILDGGQTAVNMYPYIDDSLELIDLYTSTKEIYGFSDDGEELARVQYNLVYTAETVGSAYDNVADTLIERNKNMISSCEEYLDSNVEEVKSLIDMGDTSSFYPYYDETYQYVMRSDERIISLAYYNNMYIGGAHGMYGWNGENYDPVNGTKITMTDVVNDINEFGDVLAKLILEYDDSLEESIIESSISDYESLLASGEGDYNWSMDYEGISVYFNPYELGSYAQGAQIIRVRFEDYPFLFNDYYAVRPSSYVYGGDELHGVYTDIDGDGVEEEINIFAFEGDDFDTLNIVFGIDDYSYYMDNVEGFDIKSFIIHLVDGTEYLMIDISGMNDNHRTMIISLNDDGYTITDENQAGLLRIVLDNSADSCVIGDIVPSQPTNIMLGSHIDLLSSYIGRKTYYVQNDGTFGTYADFYDVTADYILTSVADIEAYDIDEYGQATGTVTTLPSGSNMCILATDGESYVDVSVNASKYRLFIDAVDYEQKINGVSIFDLFEMIYFAG